MPSLILFVNGIIKTQMKHGIISIISCISIFRRSDAIIIPTRTNEADVACVGMAVNIGAKNRAKAKHIAETNDASPLLAPAFIPEALSENVLTACVPNIEPKSVPIASAMSALFIRRGCPFSSTIPALLDMPIKVPIVSNISMKRKVNTQIAISAVRMLLHSNWQNIGESDGGTSMADVK